MVEIACAAIAAFASIVCAVVGYRTEKRGRREDARAEQRAKEGRLQLKMINANTNLTIGLAMAMKNGKCNGELEKGLNDVQEADREYTEFLEGLAVDRLRGEPA